MVGVAFSAIKSSRSVLQNRTKADHLRLIFGRLILQQGHGFVDDGIAVTKRA